MPIEIIDFNRNIILSKYPKVVGERYKVKAILYYKSIKNKL